MAIRKLIKNKIAAKIREGMVSLDKLDASLLEKENSVKPNELSPGTVWPDPVRQDDFGMVPLDFWVGFKARSITKSLTEGRRNAITSLVENPAKPNDQADEKFINNFENLARSLGIGAVGYTKLPGQFMFRERAVMFDNVIVLLMEMPKDDIRTLPGRKAEVMFLRIYDTLGIQMAQLTGFLREHGYGAQVGHPMSSSSLYVPLAQRAGLGWCGTSGVLITPEFGPRMRLGVIYTSITNLTIRDHNEHGWIKEFCMKCNKCIRVCPANAIHDKPIIHESGISTHIDNSKCLPVFLNNHACGLCIKECPFSFNSYANLKDNFFKKGHPSI